MRTTTLRPTDVEVGATLPPMTIQATPTFIISTALATRDFQDVHHDRDAAVARGSQDIFLNILTDNGLVQRFVTDWAGPEALVRAIDIQLGVPCYAYDTLTFTGTVTDRVTVGGEQRWVIEVIGKGNLGDHVRGTVHIALPEVTS
ncbi:MaoC family dehydratase [Haloechinothrix salitolerans]|uniref:MaoC family dehydratase n=1 Tax=Haloechinothrix salitolerans TaxID=926830 RepID=A0ABW2BUB0_9PSEU